MKKCSAVSPGKKPDGFWRDIDAWKCLNPPTHVDVLPATPCCCGEDDCGCLTHTEVRIPMCDGPHRFPEDNQ